MIKLIEPTADLRAAWLDAHEEWGPGVHEDGFGVFPSDEVVSAEGFSAWLARLEREAAGTKPPAPDYRCIYRWIVDGDTVAGGIALRWGEGPFILSDGHIGYGIRPSARRRGMATWALGRMLDLAWDLALDRVLLVCEADNAASAATIERNGGALERVEETEHGPIRRYWIAAPGL